MISQCVSEDAHENYLLLLWTDKLAAFDCINREKEFSPQ